MSLNKTILRSWFATLVILLLLVPLARAAEPKPYVVIVGISEYQDPAIKPRPKAEADAKALYDLLTDKNYFSGSPDQVKLLLGKKDEGRKSEVATRENILKAIRWATANAEADDLVLLCWVGQGGPAGDRTCYFASDSTLKNRVKDAVGAAEIEQELLKVRSTRVCVLVDVNFRGYDAGQEKVSEFGLAKVFQEYDGLKDGDEDAVAKPILLLTANDGLKASTELEKHGLYTTLVLEALKGAGDMEGKEADGLVTVDELFAYVVKEAAKRVPESARRDQPIYAGRSSHFPLTKNAGVAAKVNSRLSKFDEIVRAGKVADEVAREGREFLSRMPRLQAHRDLRKKYQELADGKLSLEDFLTARREALEALKLPREDATSFADRVMRVAQMARDNYVKPVNLNDLLAAGIKGLYRDLDEKPPAAVKTRVDGIKELSEEEVKTLLADIRQQLGNREDLKGTKALDYILPPMLHSLDHHSTYFNPDDVEDFERQTKQRFIGVGIHIEPYKDMTRVITPIRGSPAYLGGIKAGDVITKVTNTVDKQGNELPEPETISTKGMKINDVVRKILGKQGTKVTLTIEREEASGVVEKEFTLKRGLVEVETVLGAQRKENDSWDYYVDAANKIAYIRLTQFALNTHEDLKKAIKDLQKQGLNGLVLDLRFNPGGYLVGSVDISDLFIDDGIIVTVKPRVGEPDEYKGKKAGSLVNFPLVVLVNGGSASASEIVSACIQDHGRGIIMGERSYGKGTVQNIMKMKLDKDRTSEVKLTVASFWRPTNKNLNRYPNSKETDDWGVVPHPDYTIKLSPTEQQALFAHLRKNEGIPRRDPPKKETGNGFEDRQLDAAVAYLRELATAKSGTPGPKSN